LTSNIGDQYFNNYDLTKAAIEQNLRQELKKHFRPEFLNRLDEIIIFNSLDLANIKKIVDIQMRIVEERLKDKKITVKLASDAREFIADKGFSPEYGARPLKRTIQKLIIDPLSIKIIQGELKPNDVVKIDVRNRQINFKKEAK
jgi:ATP-dependent Clp protease ATP-binding subunit ClpB